MTMTPATHSFELLMPPPVGPVEYADAARTPLQMRADPSWAASASITFRRQEPVLRRRIMPTPVEIDRSEEDPERWDGLS